MQKQVNINDALLRKYPEQVVLAITRNDEGKVNLMAIGWICMVSDDPVMFLTGIDDHAYTLEQIRRQKEFVIAFPSQAMAGAVLYAGTVHGHNVDKAAGSQLAFAQASQINVPILADAVANFECRLKAEYRPGNCPLIVGEVVAASVNVDESVRRLINAGPGYQLQ